MVWTGGNIQMSGAVITNRAGALLEVQGTGELSYTGGGAAQLDNAGLFRKTTAVTNTVNSGIAFNNYGAVDLLTGTLLLKGGYHSTPTASLHYALSGSGAGSGYGRLQVSGNVTNTGSLSIRLANGFVPTTNDTFTVLTAGTRSGTFANFYFPSNEVSMQLSNTANSVVVRVTEVFAADQPLLHIEKISPSSVRLYWATNYPDFHLEYKTSLTTTNWAASVASPLLSGTNFVVTNSVFGASRFYRLSRLPAPPVTPPTLTIQTINNNSVRLLWPVDDRQYTLLSNTNLAGTNWVIVTPPPTITGGNHVVTNTISGIAKFYRLINP